jgi:hypothetical protein
METKLKPVQLENPHFLPVPRGMQLINREAQSKRAEMAALGFKSGKSYRRYCKAQRRQERALLAREGVYHGE